MGFVSLKTSDGGYIDIPSAFGTSTAEHRSIFHSHSAKYAITDRIDVGIRAGFQLSETDTFDTLFGWRNSGARYSFNNLDLLFAFRPLSDIDPFSLEIVGAVSAIESTGFASTDLKFIKSGTIGFRGAYRNEPLVFSVEGHYRFRFPFNNDAATINPGDSFSVRPGVNFAVNDELSLFAGATVTLQERTRLNSQTTQGFFTTAEIDGGVNYNINDVENLSFNIGIGVLGEQNFNLGTSYTKNF